MTSGSMRRAITKPLFITLLCVLTMAPVAAKACVVPIPFEMNHIRNADMIVVGDVTGYEIVSSNETPSSMYGLITVHVQKSIKGGVSGDVKLLWLNSTFAFPDELPNTKPSIFAARRLSGEVYSHGSARWQILQASCSSPFILPYSDIVAEDVGVVLRGGSVARGEEEYWSLDQATSWELTPAIHRRESSTTLVIVALVGALGLSVLIAIWMLRRRRRSDHKRVEGRR